MNHKRVYRIYREAAWQCDGAVGSGIAGSYRRPIGTPTQGNERWSMDFGVDGTFACSQGHGG